MDIDIISTAQFGKYVSSVEDLAIAAISGAKQPSSLSLLSDLLNGQAGDKLRDTIPLQVRREIGAFFSSSKLRSAALDRDPSFRSVGQHILDPAMGAGDLLIEATHQLPADVDLIATLESWGKVLHGRDIHPDFVRLTKARLILAAVSRGAVSKGDHEATLENYFPGIQAGDGLEFLDKFDKAAHIVMNPPFTHRQIPDGIDWAGGRTNSAAIFLAKVVERARPGTIVSAILPDVIRTGARYGRLRSVVTKRLDDLEIKTYGQFDQSTDVDVFILKGMIVGPSGVRSQFSWWRHTPGATMGDHFTVSVGTVVPHRDEESQPLRNYLQAKAIPLGGEFQATDAEKRGFQQRTFSPPFVVVRRTSRPGDRSRGIGTMICGSTDVLVENHLIVLEPKDGSTTTCKLALALLDSSLARDWLDDRIRCRHLTVGAIREIPWFRS